MDAQERHDGMVLKSTRKPPGEAAATTLAAL